MSLHEDKDAKSIFEAFQKKMAKKAAEATTDTKDKEVIAEKKDQNAE